MTNQQDKWEFPIKYKKPKYAFKITPKNWWDWINPFFWRRARIMNAIMTWEWENRKDEITDKWLRDGWKITAVRKEDD